MARIAITVAVGVAVAAASYMIGAHVFGPPPETFHSGATSGPLSAEHLVLRDSVLRSPALRPLTAQGAAFGFADLVERVAPTVVR